MQQHFPQLSLIDLPPFLNTEHYLPLNSASKQQLARQWHLDPERPWLITVAMMRPGDKSNSYGLLAESLNLAKHKQWQLIVVGDGINAQAVKDQFQSVSNVHFCGQLCRDELWPLLSASDLFVWPAVNEAFGLALLEAQLAGTPLLVGDEGGVASIMENGNTGCLSPPRNAKAFARQLDALLENPHKLQQMGQQATEHVVAKHSLAQAAEKLRDSLGALL